MAVFIAPLQTGSHNLTDFSICCVTDSVPLIPVESLWVVFNQPYGTICVNSLTLWLQGSSIPFNILLRRQNTQ